MLPIISTVSSSCKNFIERSTHRLLRLLHVSSVPIGVLADLFPFARTEANTLCIDRGLADNAAQHCDATHKQEESMRSHWLNPSFTILTETRALRPAHHPQHPVADIVLVLPGIDCRRGRRRWRRWTFGVALLRGRFSAAALGERNFGLVVHDAPLGGSVAILGLLCFRLCRFDLFTRDFA